MFLLLTNKQWSKSPYFVRNKHEQLNKETRENPIDVSAHKCRSFYGVFSFKKTKGVEFGVFIRHFF